jgi:hypothetical protein
MRNQCFARNRASALAIAGQSYRVKAANGQPWLELA